MSDLLDQYGVSQETRQRLKVYLHMLQLWQSKINLIGPETLPQAWERHILDSAQLYPYLKDHAKGMADIGSGAGFPGMVLAILGIPNITLIEHDQRKMAFLREVSRETKTKVNFFAKSVDKYTIPTPLITCRAWAPLERIFNQTIHLVSQETEYWLLKSENIANEITEAEKKWRFKHKIYLAPLDSRGTILHCWQIQRK